MTQLKDPVGEAQQHENGVTPLLHSHRVLAKTKNLGHPSDYFGYVFDCDCEINCLGLIDFRLRAVSGGILANRPKRYLPKTLSW